MQMNNTTCTLWKYLSVLFLASSFIGLFTPIAFFKKDISYAFYAGPAVDIIADDMHLSTRTSPASATKWYSHIYSEAGEPDIFTPSQANYSLNSENCIIKAHDYHVQSLSPPSKTDEIDVRYSMTTRFILASQGEETTIASLSKTRHEEYRGEEAEINLRTLEETWNLTRPYMIYTETFVDYDAENSVSENSTSYTVMDFKLQVTDDGLTVERFSDIPYMKLTGYSDSLNDFRDGGKIMLVIGAVTLLIYWTRRGS